MGRWLWRLGIVGVVLAVLVGGGFAAAAWWKQNSAPAYLTANVSRGRVETVVNSTGTIKPVRTVSVGAFTSGPIAEVYVDFNSHVTKDEVIARIDDKLANAAKARDEAARDAMEADLDRVKDLRDQAKNNYDRACKLRKVKADYLSDADMDTYNYALLTAKAQVRLSEASLQQAEATLQNSKENLGYTKITAPEDGVIIERKVDPGQTVAASYQTPELFTLGLEMDKHMYVIASVDEADVGEIRDAQKLGRSVTFTVDSYPGDLFDGKVYQIRLNSTTTNNVVTYPVVIEAPNPEMKLMPGMTAKISFQVESKDDVLRVPSAALRYVPPASAVRPEDKHYVEGLPTQTDPNDAVKTTAADNAEKAKGLHKRHVWIREGDLLRAVPVTLGVMDFQFAEVLSGDLVDGQAVVTGTKNLFGPR